MYGSRCRYSHVRPKTVHEDKSQERSSRCGEEIVGSALDHDRGVMLVFEDGHVHAFADKYACVYMWMQEHQLTGA